MPRRVASLCVLLLLGLVLVPAPALAQEGGDAPPSGEGGEREPREPRTPARKLEFDAAAKPEAWQAPEGRQRRRFQVEYKTADGAEITVLPVREKREFAEYRARLLRNWTKADGAALTDADQVVEVRKAADPEVRVVEQAGTQAQPREGTKKEGLKLVAVYVRQGDDRWSVWLLGPTAAVDAQREAFLKWVDTAKPGAAPAPSTEPAPAPEGGN